MEFLEPIDKNTIPSISQCVPDGLFGKTKYGIGRGWFLSDEIHKVRTFCHVHENGFHGLASMMKPTPLVDVFGPDVFVTQLQECQRCLGKVYVLYFIR